MPARPGEVIHVQVAGGANDALTVGREYELEYRRPSDTRRDYTARLGLAGHARRAGFLVFDGPGQGEAQTLDPRWISAAREVPRDLAARHVTPVPRQGRQRGGPLRRDVAAQPERAGWDADLAALGVLRTDSLVRVLRSYCPDDAAKAQVTAWARTAADDGAEPDQVVAMLAGWLLDGLVHGNWPWAAPAPGGGSTLAAARRAAGKRAGS